MPRAVWVKRAGEWPRDQQRGSVTLVYDDRHRRRLSLKTDAGEPFLLDLAETTLLREGDGLALQEGEWIEVHAAPESLLEVTATDALGLLRLAWHFGNRHLPVQIERNRLVIRRDRVMANLVETLGGQTCEIEAPFMPESGAYTGSAAGHLATLEECEYDLRAGDDLLPPRYRGGEPVNPASMGSAPLRYDAQGRVAWNEMWRSFCHLALAGGPPHRGTLLEPATKEEVSADPQAYARVIAEIARGLSMVTALPVVADRAPGWVGLVCPDEEMAVWMLRAITVENISVRREGAVLFLPAGPRYRLEKEIKNVITSVAKTHHYWTEHRAAAK